MGDLSDFERRQIVGARLAGASVAKTAILLGASRAIVSKVMSAYMNHGKTTSAKGNSGRKSINTDRERSSYIDKDCFEKSQNYCSKGDSRTEYSS
jgi:predicted transcriptional regulator